MEPSLVHASIAGPETAVESFKTAAEELPYEDRPFHYRVHDGHDVTFEAFAVEIFPDRDASDREVSAQQAVRLIKAIHAKAGSPYLRVVLFMEQGQQHVFELRRPAS